MSKKFLYSFLAVLSLTLIANAKDIPREKQVEIIANYLRITGQSERLPESLSTGEPVPPDDMQHVKCGVPFVLDYALNRDRFDPDLVASLGALLARPVSTYQYDSPEGLFKIHYERSGPDGVRDPQTDNNGNGVPDYVDNVAIILDSVYHYIIDDLGYPIPPSDGTIGGDDKYDVYISDIDDIAFGYTQTDDPNVGSVQSVFSFMEIDNDYVRFPPYKDRPLDAVRVTVAHEYFHAVHFGMDVTETEIYGQQGDGFEPRYWMEMSATWMEEEIYDEINDYYFYLPTYFADPRLSLQQFKNPQDLHPYASVIFPIFLTEFAGSSDIIKDIWTECALQPGSDFLKAVDSVLGTEIDTLDFDGSTANIDTVRAFKSVLSEFSLWNFFTGIRANMAPEGIGYSEREAYPAFPDFSFAVYERLGLLVTDVMHPYHPDHLAVSYLKFDQLQAFKKEYFWAQITPGDSMAYIDTTYLRCVEDSCAAYDTTCNNGIQSDDCCTDWSCTAYSIVYDTLLGYDTIQTIISWHKDSVELFDLSGTNYFYLDTCGGSPDTILCDTLFTNYDYITLDSTLVLYPAFDQTFWHGWGVELLFQMDHQRDSFVVFSDVIDSSYQYSFPDPYSYSLTRDSIRDIGDPPISAEFRFENPWQYRSITFSLTPASSAEGNYAFVGNRGSAKTYSFFVTGSLVDSLRESSIDFKAVNIPPALLIPYPNPAVVSEMNEAGMNSIKFQYQVPTDNVSDYTLETPRLTMDIYTVAGEKVRTVDTVVAIDPVNFYLANERTVLFEFEWDMRNQAGSDVASGVYILHTQFFGSDRADLLEDKTTKVFIIR